MLVGWLIIFSILCSRPSQFSDPNIVSVAIQRAETLESWLPDDALITFLDLLKTDLRAATVYNTITGEGIRVKWVRRQLGMNEDV
ncbi:hypothetical protein B0H19DRAFT_1182226 [Mycena capillaripes]|nr:hypothetical protein B0H19DRAFT_1182226 [Mycena capillaripes]